MKINVLLLVFLPLAKALSSISWALFCGGNIIGMHIISKIPSPWSIHESVHILFIPMHIENKYFPSKQQYRTKLNDLRNGCLCYSAQVAITKYHTLGVLRNINLFSYSPEAGIPSSRSSRVQILMKAFWLVDGQVLIVCPHGLSVG